MDQCGPVWPSLGALVRGSQLQSPMEPEFIYIAAVALSRL